MLCDLQLVVHLGIAYGTDVPWVQHFRMLAHLQRLLHGHALGMWLIVYGDIA